MIAPRCNTNTAKVKAFLGFCAGVITPRYNTNTAKVTAFLGFCAGVITPRYDTNTAKVMLRDRGYRAALLRPVMATCLAAFDYFPRRGGMELVRLRLTTCLQHPRAYFAHPWVQMCRRHLLVQLLQHSLTQFRRHAIAYDRWC